MFATKAKKFLVGALILGLSLIVLSIVLIIVFNNQGENIDPIASQAEQYKLIEFDPQTQDDQPTDDDETRFLVPPERVPRTLEEIRQAPALTLLPSRWFDQSAALRGPSGDDNAVLPEDRKDIIKTVDNFLREYESFSAPQNPDDAQKIIGDYLNRLRPFSADNLLPSLSRRVDNRQPPQICPYLGCQVGSKWYNRGASVGPSATIRLYDSSRAFVILNGQTKYLSNDPYQPLAGQTANRSYGLLLRKERDKWIVERAASETIDLR